jgi:hypothetical protein
MLTSLVEREDLRRRSSRYAICAYSNNIVALHFIFSVTMCSNSKLVYVTLKVKVVAF